MSTSPTIYQVSQLGDEMRRLMETSYPEIWIEGELSSLSKPASGHLYFSLKDERSQLRCAMFKGRASISRYKAKAGDLVRIRAKISVYTARGDLQCIVQHMEEAGEGILQRRFEELKQSLQQEGLFAQDRKKPVPSFAKHIAVVTSASGAAVKDIISTLKRRCAGIPVTVYPTIVQGEGAADGIIEAIRNAVQHQRCDVIILSRGGGSLEDLWCFNDQSLAREIYRCPIPIVSGVGHEVDVTIADLVADLRAPTPTAAAELLSPDTDQLTSDLQDLHYRLPRSFRRQCQRLAQNVDFTGRRLVHPSQQLQQKRLNVQQASNQLLRATKTILKWQSQQIEQQRHRLRADSPDKLVAKHQDQLKNLRRRLKQTQRQYLADSRKRIESLGAQLHLVSPLATLERGFAIARDEQNMIIRSREQSQARDKITVQLKDGHLDCDVREVKP